jgi:hypothetical protein
MVFVLFDFVARRKLWWLLWLYWELCCGARDHIRTRGLNYGPFRREQEFAVGVFFF